MIAASLPAQPASHAPYPPPKAVILFHLHLPTYLVCTYIEGSSTSPGPCTRPCPHELAGLLAECRDLKAEIARVKRERDEELALARVEWEGELAMLQSKWEDENTRGKEEWVGRLKEMEGEKEREREEWETERERYKDVYRYSE